MNKPTKETTRLFNVVLAAVINILVFGYIFLIASLSGIILGPGLFGQVSTGFQHDLLSAVLFGGPLVTVLAMRGKIASKWMWLSPAIAVVYTLLYETYL